MPDNQTGTDTQSDVAAEPQSTSDAPAQDASEPGLFERIFGLGRKSTAKTGDGPSAEPTEPKAADEPTTEPQARPQTETADQIADRIRKEAQSLKDRELVRERRQDAAERAQEGDLSGLRRLAEKHRDPWALKELARMNQTDVVGEIQSQQLLEDEQRAQQQLAAQEQHAQFTNHVATLAEIFDGATVAPILGMLPEAEQQRILSGGIEGIEGRTTILREAVKTLVADAEKRGRAEGKKDAEKALRGNAIFKRELFTEFRGDTDEPETVPALTAPTSGASMNDILTDAINDKIRGGVAVMGRSS